jgi:O-antigen/teichoic acid export membrane protein
VVLFENKVMIDTSAQNTIKNSGYNIIGFIIPAITVIFITPIVISNLGVKDYGVYIFLNTVITFLGLLDLGIGVATSKHIVEYISTKQEDRLKKLIYSMNSVYFILAGIFFIACLFVGYIIKNYIKVDDLQTNYLLLFFIIGLTSFIGSFFANFNNLLASIQRYDLHIKLSMIFFVLSNIGILILSILGYKLVAILSFQLIVAVISCISFFVIVRKVFPIMKFEYGWDKMEIFKNYKYGLSVAFNNVASSSLVHFDKLIVPIFTNASSLTYYSVPGGITNRISGISGTLSSLLFPITVNLHSLNNIEKIKRVYIRSVRLITILSASISLAMMFMADKILLFWLNADFVRNSLLVFILLILTNFILAIFSPLSNLLMAMNKMKFLTTWSIVMAVVNIISLFVFMPLFGINGAALAYLIGVLPIFCIFYLAERNYFKESYFRNHLVLFAKIIATAIPLFLIEKFSIYPLINSFIMVIIFGPICVAVFLLLFKLFGFVETEDWNDFKTFVFRFIKRIKLEV